MRISHNIYIIIFFISFAANAQIVVKEEKFVDKCKMYSVFNTSSDTLYFITHSMRYEFRNNCMLGMVHIDSVLKEANINVSNTDMDFHWAIPNWDVLQHGEKISYIIENNSDQSFKQVFQIYVRAIKVKRNKKHYRRKKVQKIEGEWRSFLIE